MISSRENGRRGFGCACERFGIYSEIRAKGSGRVASQRKGCFWCFWKKSYLSTVCSVAKNASPKAAPSVEGLTIIVICPLSIIEEPITSNEFNLSSAELKFEGEMLNVVRNSEIQVVYAEQVLNEKFTLKETVLFSSLVVSHCCG